MLNKIPLFGLLLLLSSCAYQPTIPPKVITAEVAIPVTRKVAIPVKPEMPLQSASSKEPFDVLIKKALAEIELRKSYELELETSVDACNK